MRFRLLYVWFIIDHGRRRIIHFNVTANPTAQWVIQQLREAFPDDSAPRYLIFDNDTIFSDEATEAIKHFGTEPKRTAFQSPWQNGVAERWVGSCKREIIDHVIVLNEEHLRRLLRDFTRKLRFLPSSLRMARGSVMTSVQRREQCQISRRTQFDNEQA